MVLKNLYTNTIVVARLTSVSGNRTSYSTVTGAGASHPVYGRKVSIHRMDEEKEIGVSGDIGKLFRLYCGESVDIEQGDKLIDKDTGDEYKVDVIEKPSILGNFVHKEATIRRVK
jgi:hypothetical protein